LLNKFTFFHTGKGVTLIDYAKVKYYMKIVSL